jgi:DNA sulfur modification protein DndD
MSEISFVRIELQNFVNVGSSSLDFPAPSPGHNALHLVVGFNGFGKTTLLHAFAWCLTGELATFGNDLSNVSSVHSANWDREKLGSEIPVKVSLLIKILDENGTHDVLIVRSRLVHLASNSTVLSEDKDIIEVLVSNDLGAFIPHPDPISFLSEHFPSELKDAFILNGDATLRFIQTGGDARRGRIMNTIKALMDVKYIQDAENHIGSARSKIVTEANKNQPNSSLELLQQAVDTAEKSLQTKKTDFGLLSDQKLAAIELKMAAKQKLDELLSVWGEDALKLRDEFNQIKGSFEGLRADVRASIAKLRQDSNSSTALHAVAHTTLNKAQLIFDEMRAKGEIPNTLPSVLETVLSSGVCVCGTKVSMGSEAHSHIIEELKALGERSEIAEVLQGLSISMEQSFANIPSWASILHENQLTLMGAQANLNHARARYNQLKAQVESMPSEAIQSAIKEMDRLDLAIIGLSSGVAHAEHSMNTAQKEYEEAKKNLDKLVSGDDKYQTLKMQISVAERMQKVHQVLLDLMKTDVVKAISNETNEIFTKVLGVGKAGSNFDLPITGVEITHDYDLRGLSHVETVNLDPIHFSGAQMRVLTSALLLAMYEFSNRNIQLIFDTPVAMMDGPVKKGFIKELLNRSKQTVLLVTNDELVSADEFFPFVTSIATVEHVSVINPGDQKFPAETRFVEQDPRDVNLVLSAYRSRYEDRFIDPTKSTAIRLD